MNGFEHWVLGSLGGSPGLVVMGGDSCSDGRGFEFKHIIRDGHWFVVKIVLFVCRKDENKQKEAGEGPFVN